MGRDPALCLTLQLEPSLRDWPGAGPPPHKQLRCGLAGPCVQVGPHVQYVCVSWQVQLQAWAAGGAEELSWPPLLQDRLLYMDRLEVQ